VTKPVAVAVALAALACGCTNTTGGRPSASPGRATEPTFPTQRPTRTPPPTATAVPPTASTVPAPPQQPGGQALPPSPQGYVYIETKSGKTRCQISTAQVGCESEFTNSPIEDGVHANGVRVTADGNMRWIVGNLGDIPVVTIDYRTYTAQGWTVDATSDGTRFTNDKTGHGMFVSIDTVQAF
jgi:hypothetical protein